MLVPLELLRRRHVLRPHLHERRSTGWEGTAEQHTIGTTGWEGTAEQHREHIRGRLLEPDIELIKTFTWNDWTHQTVERLCLLKYKDHMVFTEDKSEYHQ